MKLDTVQLILDVLKERERQKELYSWKHDCEHTGAEWIALITMYLGKVANGEFGKGPAEYDKRLIQVAALVLAALEHERARK